MLATLRWLTGDATAGMTPDTIRDALYGTRYAGVTFAGDLASYMRRWGLDCQALVEPDVRQQIKGALGRGDCLTALVNFYDGAPDLVGHFVPVIGYDRGGATLHQVYGGGETWQPWAWWERNYRGWVIVTRRKGD